MIAHKRCMDVVGNPLLGGLLLVLVLVLVASGASKGLLEDLKDLLILDLLIRLNLLEIGSGGGGELGDTILGNG